VTEGLVESNGSVAPGMTLKVTCGLTAGTPGSAPGPSLGYEYGRTFITLVYCHYLCFTSDERLGFL